jgi:hypothetical protein
MLINSICTGHTVFYFVGAVVLWDQDGVCVVIEVAFLSNTILVSVVVFCFHKLA